MTVDVSITNIQLILASATDMRRVTREFGDSELNGGSVNIVIPQLETSLAGMYVCNATLLNGTTGFIFSETYILNISSKIMNVSWYSIINLFTLFLVPSPQLLSTITAGNRLLGRTFETGSVFLSCHGSYTNINDTVITVNWFGPNGLVDGSRYTTELSLSDDNNSSNSFYDSVLTISDLSLSQDNGAQYYCVVEVSLNDTLPEAPYVIPGTAISDNITVTLEGAYTLARACKKFCHHM